MRRLIALALSAAALVIVPSAEAATGPINVHVTIRLLGSGDHEVKASGHARPGTRVYLQDRFDEHDNFATQKTGRAASSGSFKLSTTTHRTDGAYRVCVARPGKDACTRGASARVVQRHGTVTLTAKASRIVPVDSTFVASGHVSKWLIGRPLRFDYLDPATSKWVDASGYVRTETSGADFTVQLVFDSQTLPVAKLGLPVRVRAEGSGDVKRATAVWQLDSYVYRSLATFPVVSGTLLQRDIWMGSPIYGGSTTSHAITPDGPGASNSATITVPAGCGRIQGRVKYDDLYAGSSSYPPFTASIARNGSVAWSVDSSVPGQTSEFSVVVAGGDTLTLTASYPAAEPLYRPWFAAISQYVGPLMPFALCAAP